MRAPRSHLNWTRESSGFNVGEECFIALSCRRFRKLACRWDRGRIVGQSRAPTAPVATWGKNVGLRLVYELAYSTTSSSAKDSLWPGAAYPSKRGSQRSCDLSSRQPSKASERTRRPQRPPCARSPQRARRSLGSARDRGAPRRRLNNSRGNHKTPRGHRKQP